MSKPVFEHGDHSHEGHTIEDVEMISIGILEKNERGAVVVMWLDEDGDPATAVIVNGMDKLRVVGLIETAKLGLIKDSADFYEGTEAD